jgi:hypothetical protein
MNARLEFVKDKIQANIQSLVLWNGIIAFITAPITAMVIFNIKRDLVTLSLLTTLAYWIIVFLWYSRQAKQVVA